MRSTHAKWNGRLWLLAALLAIPLMNIALGRRDESELIESRGKRSCGVAAIELVDLLLSDSERDRLRTQIPEQDDTWMTFREMNDALTKTGYHVESVVLDPYKFDSFNSLLQNDYLGRRIAIVLQEADPAPNHYLVFIPSTKSQLRMIDPLTMHNRRIDVTRPLPNGVRALIVSRTPSAAWGPAIAKLETFVLMMVVALIASFICRIAILLVGLRRTPTAPLPMDKS
jgi:hypothetical protein